MAKTSWKTKITAFVLIFILSITQIPTTVQAASTRPADVKKAEKGNILIGVFGTFERVDKSDILKRINDIRKEACTKGYINPNTGRKLKPSDYVPLKWSANLEWIAQLRSAECTVNEGHTRPNGKSCFSINYKDEQSWGENLAWNYSGLMRGIEQWYDEKKDWVNQNTNAVTGHYTNLINPEYKFIGLASFVRDSGGWYGISAELGYSTAGSQSQSKVKGKTVQTIEVTKNNTNQMKLNAPSSLKLKKSKQLTITCNITFPGIMGGQNTTQGKISKNVTWKSSKPSVISVKSNGKITAKKAGKATITAKIKGGKTLKKTITVKR